MFVSSQTGKGLLNVGEDGRGGGFDASWRPYVSMGDVTSGSFTRTKLKAAGAFLTSRMPELTEGEALDDVMAAKRFYLDTAEVASDPDVLREWPDFRSDLRDKLEMVLGVFGLACSDMIVAQSSSAAFFAERTQQTTIR